MLKLTPETKIDVMRSTNKPAASCKDGDTVVFETLDCYDGIILHDGTRVDRPRMHNPATGPLFIEGAEKGDVLKVEILSIRANSWGALGTSFGEFGFKNVEGHDDKMYVLELRDNKTEFAGHTLTLENMIGVIGVAPNEGTEVLTVTPGSHGGNMDCNRIIEGSTIYFPVETAGALLSIGDLHALMGDGEVFGYGLEVTGEVTVRVSVIKNKTIAQPVLVLGDRAMTIASADTFECANELALESMFELVKASGVTPSEAGILMTLKCDLAICQTVNPLMTVRAEMPLDMIKLPE